MSDEYTIAGNFQKASDDPRAVAEYEYRMKRVREREAELDDRETGCTHCGGEGLCWDGSDPLGDCPDDPHRCHACGGSGRGCDQTIF